MKQHAIAIHGGAGTILKSSMTDEKEAAYKNALQAALLAGEKVLEAQGSALDAVEMAVRSLEDNELFNAGKGSVFTHDGKHEMDASIMDGKNLMAGAVAGIDKLKNPVSFARMVMEKTEHVFLSGAGAMELARKLNVQQMPDDYFFTQQRFEQLAEIRNSDKMQLDHSDKKFGTVGAVALDVHGNIAAATSTGGMTNKKFGRVGDSPMIGAGTYANNASCAVSCTGHGEFFIRAVVAYDVACLVEYKGLTLAQACEKVVNDKLVKLGGEGGLIALDKAGNISLVFNSEGMYRGYKRQGEDMYLGIYK
ncbi:MAG TPA: isoaspartyl peptidase/L-asparaginase [Bacteroidia bacterium]|nr:isoaspartyl peptidase/L-asparaginase [Bacteroidia bacterium]HRH09633.1 isoaspartyl peptidase/L-asparaginase [Bacteroidia bacterium]